MTDAAERVVMPAQRPLLWYFAIAFGVSWGGVLLALPGGRALWFVAMLLGPPIASIVLTLALDGVRGLRDLAQTLLRWRFDTHFYVAPFVVPALLFMVLTALSLLSSSFVPGLLTSSSRGGLLATALVVGILAGTFEELGWTGFATPRLLRRYTWFGAGFALGAPWALWHMLPDYLGRTMHGGLWVAHAVQWFVALIALRMLMTWLYVRTKSLLLAVVMHATFTGSQVLLWPASTAPGVELVWYGVFASALWFVVVLASERDHRELVLSARLRRHSWG